MVEVDKNDPAFRNPTKRVGRIYNKEQADRLAKEKGWEFREEVKVKDGWRRVVPSPQPVSILNEKLVETMAKRVQLLLLPGGRYSGLYR
jgi:carbamate kinase